MNSPHALLATDRGTLGLCGGSYGFLATPMRSLDLDTYANTNLLGRSTVISAYPFSEPAVYRKHLPWALQPPGYRGYSVGFFLVYSLYTRSKTLKHWSAGPAAACCETRSLHDLPRGEAAPGFLPLMYPPSKAVATALASGTPAATSPTAPNVIAIKAACRVFTGTATAAATLFSTPASSAAAPAATAQQRQRWPGCGF